MSTYVYQANSYFGIHYDAELSKTIIDIAAKNGYKGLSGDDSEHIVSKNCKLYASLNSDDTEKATRGYIFVDEMTFGGADFDKPEECFINIEPSEQEKREETWSEGVLAIEKLYDVLIAAFKKKKLSNDAIYLGWSTLICTWDDDNISESESDEEPIEVPQRKPRAQKAAPAPMPVPEQPKRRSRSKKDEQVTVAPVAAPEPVAAEPAKRRGRPRKDVSV